VREAARLDPRIRLVRLEKNGGPGPARNVGMAEARGRLLAFQDSEDLWTADRLERQIAFMRAHDAALTVCSYSMIDERGRPVGRPVRMPERIEYATLLKNTIIAVITTLADRERVGPLVMPPLPQHEDLVMWFGVLKRGVVAHGMPDVLARYRLVGGSASRDKWRSARRMWRVYRRVEGLSVPRAAWCYANYAWNAWRKYRR
jgi:teichuronic acid biosynthesis glycosyltransferase TuaG